MSRKKREPEGLAPPEDEKDPFETPLPVKRVRIFSEMKPVARLPSREEIAQLAIDAYRLALDNVRTYKNKQGDVVTSKAPDFRGACEALRVLSAVSGHTAKSYPSAYEADEARRKAEEKLVLRELGENVARSEEEAKMETEELDASAALERLRSRTAVAEEKERGDE